VRARTQDETIGITAALFEESLVITTAYDAVVGVVKCAR